MAKKMELEGESRIVVIDFIVYFAHAVPVKEEL